ncbi:peptidase inhibitor 16-like [Cebidichthys violaceus]|uniref:peptidase inhibitor 16-like n=1 Tax=Cebidichthys violaceus TaxID=271503 RepID=UPI0035CB8C84
MRQRSLSELQGVSARRTTQDGASRGPRPRRGSSGHRCPPRGAPLWAWLLLGALVVPGAWSFLSEEQEELLVELHNHYRGQVSPSASAMLPLRWDPSLKVIAEGYAAKCIWNHNPELEDTGENLYVGTGPLDLREALEKWFLEHLDYDFQNNSCDEDQMCGHYTQMVWADTHRVGCAFHLCNNMEGLDWERVSYLVCNYYPAGNYEDERPFVEGEWCSRCPENLQKCENNLCVADTAEEDDDDEDDDEEMDLEEETVVPPPGTSGPTLQPEEEEATAPPPGTSGPSLQPEEEKEEEAVVPPPVTSGPSFQPEEEKEEEAVVPPPGTSGPSFQPKEEEEEEAVVPLPTTTDPDVQPATTTATPSTTTTTAEGDSEDPQPPDTPAPGTHPPEVPSTPQGKEEKTEEKMEETLDKMEGKKEKDVKQNIYQNTKVSVAGADSASSPSLLLLVCLTGILTLRL